MKWLILILISILFIGCTNITKVEKTIHPDGSICETSIKYNRNFFSQEIGKFQMERSDSGEKVMFEQQKSDLDKLAEIVNNLSITTSLLVKTLATPIAP